MDKENSIREGVKDKDISIGEGPAEKNHSWGHIFYCAQEDIFGDIDFSTAWQLE